MPTHAPRRITIVADELLGYVRTGGLGTATSFLAVGLGRMGHQVEFLYVGEEPRTPLGAEWAALYDDAGIRIRMLPRSGEHIEPSYFARAHDVELALHSDPPDVVITQDLAAPAYTALRMRQLGLAFERTLFVVYCHGGRRWITDMAQKVRVLPGAVAVSLLEQASVELADIVVSPSRYLLQWMRDAGAQLPDRSLVIPYLSRSAATGGPGPEPAELGRRVERIAFFGRLEERKGLRPFAAALNVVEPALLERVELEFVGAATPAWPPERIEGMLSDTVKTALRGISFETDLDQPEALSRLSRPGTLAVMPSFGETFSNAVYECLERGIPFIASDTGAPPELIAASDHARVLFEPTAEGIAAALRRALDDGSTPQPARLAFDPADAVDAWREVVAREPTPVPPAQRTREEEFVLLPGDVVSSEELLETLSRAQAASGADVVTCGVRDGEVQRFFLGDPGGLGLVSNSYGTVALIRRSLLSDDTPRDGIWPLLARLAVGGARIVSIPLALVDQQNAPGDPAEALRVREHFERQLPGQLRSLAHLAAGLAANSHRAAAPVSLRGRLVRLVRRR